MLINIQDRYEDEVEEEDEAKNQQYEMMMKELKEFSIEYKDFKLLLEQRVKQRQMMQIKDKDKDKGDKSRKGDKVSKRESYKNDNNFNTTMGKKVTEVTVW